MEITNVVEVQIHKLTDQEPKEDERVMVWNEKFREWCPQVFNKHYECWDTEDGDDCDRDLNENDYWFSLPGKPA